MTTNVQGSASAEDLDRSAPATRRRYVDTAVATRAGPRTKHEREREAGAAWKPQRPSSLRAGPGGVRRRRPQRRGQIGAGLPAGSRPGARRPGATAPAATSLSAIFRAAAGWPGPRDLSRAAAHLPDPVNRGMSLEAIAAMLAQSRRTCRLPGCPARVGRHVNSAANRAVITTAADHPSWGDAWVVRRTARCGSLEERSR